VDNNICGAALDNRADVPEIRCELELGHEGTRQCGGWSWPGEPKLATTEFAEPWKMDLDCESDTCGQILNADGLVVVDPYGSTLEEFAEEARYMRRIACCVNACQGISTELLEAGVDLHRAITDAKQWEEPKPVAKKKAAPKKTTRPALKKAGRK
jgi:hypothetical protein